MPWRAGSVAAWVGFIAECGAAASASAWGAAWACGIRDMLDLMLEFIKGWAGGLHTISHGAQLVFEAIQAGMVVDAAQAGI